MRIAVLVKQIPRFEEMALGPDGRLQREGLELEMNPYCRRAVSKGVELARELDGTCTVFTLGPPAAEDVLREALAWGADEGVLVTDPRFAGSDTLATSRALAQALEREGSPDLILLGRNSVDADTGQVGPQLAELLGLPFLTAVRALQITDRKVRARCEHDDGWSEAELALPAVLSCAERLCEPAKSSPESRAEVPDDRLKVLGAADLGPGPWGQQGSPTRVGEVRILEAARERRILEGTPAQQVEQAVARLVDSGALGSPLEQVASEETVPDGWERGQRVVAVVVEAGRARVARELLGAGARLASEIGGSVTALAQVASTDGAALCSWGADAVVALQGAESAEDFAGAYGDWCEAEQPWAVLVPGTVFGREVASRISARLGAGLTGDAVELTVDGKSLVAWKPAFGGRLVAAITADSAVQLATVRPGMLPLMAPRNGRAVEVSTVVARPARRVVELDSGRDDDIETLATAEAIVGVGTGVSPEEYEALSPLLSALNAELGATRKVTDRGWQPRSRQIGITGRSVSPRLYVPVGVSGKFNHAIGARGAGMILAINADPEALIFDSCDIGIVADWHEVVPLLAERIEASRLAKASAGSA